MNREPNLPQCDIDVERMVRVALANIKTIKKQLQKADNNFRWKRPEKVGNNLLKAEQHYHDLKRELDWLHDALYRWQEEIENYSESDPANNQENKIEN